jgi:hypothetical protein
MRPSADALRFTMLVIAVLTIVWTVGFSPLRASRASQKVPTSTTMRFVSGR